MPENALCYFPFNISELEKIACTAVGARSCSEFLGEFAKTGEGPNIFRKFLAEASKSTHRRGHTTKPLVSNNNGSEAIVKIPSKHIRTPFLATASEVATLMFACEVLGLPAPCVLSWNGHADDKNQYLIMEKWVALGWLIAGMRSKGPSHGVFQGSFGRRKQVRVRPVFTDWEFVFREGREPRAAAASVP